MDKKNIFWPSFVDLMTSLFFVMLVLFVYYFIKMGYAIDTLGKQAEELKRIKKLTELLKPIEEDKVHFKKDNVYNRYLLTRDIQFSLNQYNISNDDNLIGNPTTIRNYLKEAGTTLKKVVDDLGQKKDLEGAKYLVVLTGTASRTDSNEEYNMILSYKRAKSLYEFWRDSLNFDLDAPHYHKVLELSIGGLGFGGAGRESDEVKNQRIIIQIVPKPKIYDEFEPK